MTARRRAYADGPFGQVHYQQLGTGPAVVLLHQAPMTSSQYDNVYEPLARRGFRVIGVDMPGFGMSDATPFVPTIEDFAAASFAPVLDAEGLATASVVGHHTGALVATEVALQFPDRVDAVVLNGPFPMEEAKRRQYLDTMTPREKAIKAEPGGGHLATLFQGREKMAAGTVPLERLSNYVIQSQMGQGAYWYGHHAAFQYRHEVTIMALRHRTLILTNTGDQIYAEAQWAHRLRPDFAYVELEGGGVDIVDQAPEAWAQAVADFLHAARG